MFEFGHKTYDRGAFEEHGCQNYTDAMYGSFNGKPAKVYPDKRENHDGWQKQKHGKEWLIDGSKDDHTKI